MNSSFSMWFLVKAEVQLAWIVMLGVHLEWIIDFDDIIDMNWFALDLWISNLDLNLTYKIYSKKLICTQEGEGGTEELISLNYRQITEAYKV